MNLYHIISFNIWVIDTLTVHNVNADLVDGPFCSSAYLIACMSQASTLFENSNL